MDQSIKQLGQDLALAKYAKNTCKKYFRTAEHLSNRFRQPLAELTSVTIAGQSLTPAQIVQSLQTRVDLRTAVLTAQASAKAKVSAETTQSPPLRALMKALTAYVRASFLIRPRNSPTSDCKRSARTPHDRSPGGRQREARFHACRGATRWEASNERPSKGTSPLNQRRL
jgi:hypothetical protein